MAPPSPSPPPWRIAAGSASSPPGYPPAPSPASGLPSTNNGNWSSFIGIATAIAGNILISFALNVQRYAHIRLMRERDERLREWERKREASAERPSHDSADSEEDRRMAISSRGRAEACDGGLEEQREQHESDPLLPSSKAAGRARRAGAADAKQTSYLKSPYWWLGIVMMTTGEAGNFLAYGFAPASIVSPLGVVALISNCIIAPVMLKEPFRRRDALGVLVAVAGAVTVVASASDNNPKLGPDQIWDLIATWEFGTYLAISLAVAAALAVASNRFGEKSILVDLGLVGLFGRALGEHGVVLTLLGGYTALSTKGVASLLSYTLWRVLTFPVTYLLVVVLAATAVLQIKYVNRALQRFDATQVIPTQFVLFTLFVIVGSAVLYRDFERTSGSDAAKFVGGCALTFLGVWLITSGRAQRHGDADGDPESDDRRGAIGLVNGDGRGLADVDEAAEGDGDEPESSTSPAKSPSLPIHRPHSSPLFATPTVSAPSDHNVPSLSSSPPASSVPAPSSPLTANPWNASQSQLAPPESPRTPPPLRSLATLSTPVLPFATPPAPSPHRNRSDNAVPSATTPGSAQPSAHLLGFAGPRVRRHRSGTADRGGSDRALGRGAPLVASPLSTSLSAVVADLRRARRGSGGEGAARAADGAGDDAGRVVDLSAGGRRGRLGELWRGIRGERSRECEREGDADR